MRREPANPMRSFLASAMLLAAVPVASLAQTMPGLDLSQPPPKEPEKTSPEEQPGLDLSKPPEPEAEPKAKVEEKPRAIQPFSEKDVALGDKVKAVQRKGFMKRGRFEIAPVFAATVNDAFYEKFGGGLRLAYNIHDAFAVALRGNYYRPYRTDNVREGKIAFGSQLLSSQLDGQLMLDGIWSPVYGKAAFLGRSIIHFDVYLSAGFGLVWTASGGPPLEQGAFCMKLPFASETQCPKLAADVGGGVRFYPKEWLAFDVGLNATLYPDQPAAQLPATLQKVFVANVGFSFFLPTTFEYVHP